MPKSRRHEKGYIRGYDARTGKRLWIFHTIPLRGEFGYDTWENESAAYTGNVGVWAQMTVDEELGIGLPAGGAADRRLLRRPSSRQHPVLREPGRARSQDGQAQVALPAGAPRHLGLRHPVRADPRGHHGQRQADQGDRAADQAGVALRVRSRDRTAGVADRGAAGRKGRRSRRVVRADAAVRDQAAGVRSTGRVDRRSDRLHAGSCAPKPSS